MKLLPGNVQTSQSSGVEVLKCSELRCQGVKRRFRKPKHTKELINEDSYRYTWNLLKIFRNLRTQGTACAINFSVRGVLNTR